MVFFLVYCFVSVIGIIVNGIAIQRFGDSRDPTELQQTRTQWWFVPAIFGGVLVVAGLLALAQMVASGQPGHRWNHPTLMFVFPVFTIATGLLTVGLAFHRDDGPDFEHQKGVTKLPCIVSVVCLILGMMACLHHVVRLDHGHSEYRPVWPEPQIPTQPAEEL